MSAISDFAARVKASFDEFSASVDTIVEGNTSIGNSVAGLTGDVAQMKALIEKLQTSPGGVTPEDQAFLDALEQQINAASARAREVASIQKAQSDALKALDEATAPAEVPTP